jgi:hypothetical protein
MNPESQIQLAIQLENVAAHGGLPGGGAGPHALGGSASGNDAFDMTDFRELVSAGTTLSVGTAFTPIFGDLHPVGAHPDSSVAAALTPAHSVAQVAANHVQLTVPGDATGNFDVAFALPDQPKLS